MNRLEKENIVDLELCTSEIMKKSNPLSLPYKTVVSQDRENAHSTLMSL